MIQFLQEEIQTLKPFKHKTLHEETVRDDLALHYHQLSSIVNANKEACLLAELEVEEKKDELQLVKMEKTQELQEKKQELEMARLEKNRLMKECELNELKLRTNRQINSELLAKQEAAKSQKTNLMKQIKQTDVICERINLQSEQLRQKCEEEIKNVTSEQFNLQSIKNEIIVRQKLEQNQAIISKIITLTESQHQNCIRLNQSDIRADSQRVIELTRELQNQNAQNMKLRGHLKCEEIKYLQLSSRLEIINKANQVQQLIGGSIYKEEEELGQAVAIQKAKNDELQSKLSQYRRLRKELEDMYGNLSTNFDSCKHSDLHGIRQMNKHSYRMERNINQQRHFLKERYSIVDIYRKYLRNN